MQSFRACNFNFFKFTTQFLHLSEYIYNSGLPGLGKGKVYRQKGHGRIIGDILYGLDSVFNALLRKKRKVYKAYIKNEISNSKNIKIKNILILLQNTLIEYVPRQRLNELSCNRPHQGIVLDVSPVKFVSLQISDLFLPNKAEIWLYLYNIKDPMNLGAILRSSFYFGIGKVIVSENSCPLTNVVSKASAGALEVMDIYQVHDSYKFLKMLKELGWQIITTQAFKKNNHKSTLVTNNLTCLQKKPSLIIFGNESEGIPDLITNYSDVPLTISPDKYSCNDLQLVESLNVSVSLGIILHQIVNHYNNTIRQT